ncbi:MAG: heavy metal translocating P-type ATPase [Spirochaetaceae bacterium]|jgi:heavy metal translocating P-type ATPase|nr:heavy metal translocating P-type ATPase [Spirochaetaceae bacterium]
MNYKIIHELPGRIRLCCGRYALSPEKAAALEQFLLALDGIKTARVSSITGSVLLVVNPGLKNAVLERVDNLDINTLPDSPLFHNLEGDFQNKLFNLVSVHLVTRYLLPAPARMLYTCVRALRFVGKGIAALFSGRLSVEVLDAAAVTVSIAQDSLGKGGGGAGSMIMFMLTLSEILEEYTHKKSKDALAASFSLNIDSVWKKTENGEISVPLSKIVPGDIIVVRSGVMIPLDGEVFQGEGLVCQASLTGEPLPVLKRKGNAVFAGTVLEEGELTVKVNSRPDETRIEKIISIIDESEGLKAKIQNRAEKLADSIVPFSFAGAAFMMALTGNVTKAISFLMVDYSCAIKLSIPIAVLASMQEAARRRIFVKGGKFLEAISKADTIIFDKTGTLTEAKPLIAKVIPTAGESREKVLSMAACLEEHFPHSVANAVVRQAETENLKHREEHSKLEYVVAHGVAAYYADSRVVLGSYHFVFEDEKTSLSPEEKALIEKETEGYSAIFLAREGRLLGIICFTDPPRKDAPLLIAELRDLGFSKIVMITGDNAAAARRIAEELGIDEYHAEVLPQTKSALVKQYRAEGHTVIMVGDGINDAPALAAADVGIAMTNGCDLAREVADLVLLSDDLQSLCRIIEIGKGLLARISDNYRKIMIINTSLLALSLGGLISPGTSALLHNLSTFILSASSNRPYLPDDE